MTKKYSKTPDIINEEERKYCNKYIYDNYYKLICAMCKKYWRYLTPHLSYEDLCVDTYIGLCRVYSYRYNFKNINQSYFILTSIIQLLDTRFPKNIKKVKWEQSLVSTDAPNFNGKSTQYSKYKPCESIVVCKYFVDSIFHYINIMPVDRFYGNKSAMNIVVFLKFHFLKIAKYEIYDLPHIIDLLGYNLHLCEVGPEKRGKLFNMYKRYLHSNGIRKYANTQLSPNHTFNIVLNYFVVRLRMHLFRQGLYEYLVKDEE